MKNRQIFVDSDGFYSTQTGQVIDATKFVNRSLAFSNTTLDVAAQYQRNWTSATGHNSPQLEFNHKIVTAGSIANGEGEPHSNYRFPNFHEIRAVNKKMWPYENQPRCQVTELPGK